MSNIARAIAEDLARINYQDFAEIGGDLVQSPSHFIAGNSGYGLAETHHRCEYCGAKNNNQRNTCSQCGAPL